MKRILYSIVFLLIFNVSYAQEEVNNADNGKSEEKVEKKTKKMSCVASKITVSVIFGNNNMIQGLVAPGSVVAGGAYGPNEPRLQNVIVNNAAAVNMAGIKARAFLNDNIAVSLLGGINVFRNPSREFIQGYNRSRVGNAGVIPSIRELEQKTDMHLNLAIGGEYHFRKGNMSPYIGISLPFYAGRNTAYNPKFEVVQVPDPTPSLPNRTKADIRITDVGIRVAEMIGFGAQLVSGIDYYLKDDLYIGFEIKPFSFAYAFTSAYPAPGLPSAKSEAYGFGVFSQPLFKFGFVF